MAREIARTVDASGASIAVDRVTVEFPQGAFTNPISVTVSVDDTVPSGPSFLKAAYLFHISGARPSSPSNPDRRQQAAALGAAAILPRKPIAVTVKYDGLFPGSEDLSLVSVVTLDMDRRWRHADFKRDDQGKALMGQITVYGTFAVALNRALRPVQPASSTVGVAGGTVQYSQRVTVQFPPGAVESDTRVEIDGPGKVAPPWRGGLPFVFSVVGRRASDGASVTRFKRPITLTFSYEDSELGRVPPAALQFSYFSEDVKRWIPIPAKLEQSGHRVIAEVDHLTSFKVSAAGNEVYQDVLPTVQLAGTDLFTGSSVFRYPIELSPGTGGLTPKLFLTYNGQSSRHSQRANYLENLYDPPGGVQTASPAGQGFDVELGHISFRKIWWNVNGQDNYEERYYLTLNGETQEMLLGSDGYWHTKIENYMRISRDSTVPNGWEVIAKDGTRYQFGLNDLQKRVYVWWEDNGTPHQSPNLWMLGRVQDMHGNTIDYDYERIARPVWRWTWSNPCDYTPAVFPLQITYSGGKVVVRFNRTNFNSYYFEPGDSTRRVRDDNGQAAGIDRDDVDPLNWIQTEAAAHQQHFFDVKALDSIDVYVDGGATFVRKYKFDWDTYVDQWLRTKVKGIPMQLPKVTVWGDQNGVNKLPSLVFTTFDYRDYDEDVLGNRYNDGVDEHGHPTQPYWLLTSIDNGMGGTVSFEYEFADVPEYLDKFGPEGRWFKIRVARVKRQSINAGIGAPGLTPVMSTSYQYTDPIGNNDLNWPEFRGHHIVTAVREYLFEGVPTPYSSLEHSFCQGRNDTRTVSFGARYRQFSDLDQFRGREYLAKTKSYYGVVFSIVDQEWASRPEAGVSNFVYLTDRREYSFDKNQTDENFTLEKRTSYPDYDAYGNVRQIQYYGSTADGGDDYTVARAYVANTSAWIVDRLLLEQYFEGIGTGGRELSRIGFYYDRDANGSVRGWGDAPTKGDLVASDRVYDIWPQHSWTQHSWTQYWYDVYGNRVKEQDPNGNLTQYLDQSGNLGYDSVYHAYPYRVRNAKGHDTVTEYDFRWGKVKTITDPNYLQTVYSYDTFGRLNGITRGGGTYRIIDYYDWLTGPRVFEVDVTEPIDATTNLKTRYFYDGAGRLVQRQVASVSIDGATKDLVVDYSYDPYGRKVAESMPYATEPYSGGGNPYKTPDITKPSVTTGYDPFDRVTQVSRPGETPVTTVYGTVAYGSFGNKEYRSVVDQRGHRKDYLADALGRLLEVKEYSGQDPNTSLYATTAYSYDRLGNLLEVIDEAGNQTRIQYDERGLKAVLHDPDMSGTNVEGPVGYWWRYEYDAAGNLIRQTDAKGNVIEFGYDALNRLVRKYYPMDWGSGDIVAGVSKPSVYDIMELRNAVGANRVAAGLAVYNWTDPALVAGKEVKVRAVHFTELRTAIQELLNSAGLGPPTYQAKEFTSGPIIAGTRVIKASDLIDLRDWLEQYESSTWAQTRRARAIYGHDEYDGANQFGVGRRTSVIDVSGRRYYRCDQRGRLVRDERILDGAGYVTQYTYDSADRVATMAYPDNEVLTYTYGNHAQLTAISSDTGVTYLQDAKYNHLLKPKTFFLANGYWTTFRYYGSGLDVSGAPYGALQSITTDMGQLQVIDQKLEHTYDNVGNLTRWVDIMIGEDFTYEYDDLDRLSKRKITGGADQETFEYNQIGNLTTKNGLSYTYGSPIHVHAVTSFNGVSYAYNDNGNMVTAGGFSYTYDKENRLIKASDTSGVKARFAYDGDGWRGKRVDANGTIHYVGNHYERNVGNGVNTTEIVTKYYYAKLGSVNRLIALRKNGALKYIWGDHLGSTTKSCEDNSTIAYTAYGETRSGGTNLPTDKRFTGQTLDLSTGLYWYGSRPYNPMLGRFSQPDTVVPDYKNPQALNRYAYGYNNPVKYLDPTGHAAEDLQHLIPGWYDQGWHDEFVQDHGHEPEAVDYVYRFMTMGMAKGSGYAAEDILRSITTAIGAGLKPSGPGLWSQTPDQTGLKAGLQDDDRRFYGDNFSDLRWGKVRVVFTDNGLRGELVRWLGGGKPNATTFNANLIVFSRPLDFNNPYHQWWLMHELRHIMQAQELGMGYLLKYFAGVPYGHRHNPMEFEANEFANASGTGVIRWD